jgi:hypothetical protein
MANRLILLSTLRSSPPRSQVKTTHKQNSSTIQYNTTRQNSSTTQQQHNKTLAMIETVTRTLMAEYSAKLQVATHRHSKAVTACLADGLGPDEGKKLQKAAQSFKDDVDFCSGMLDTMRISLAAHRLARGNS